MKHLPNILSAVRFPAGIVVLLACATGHWPLAFWAYLIAALTDAIDGPLARRLHAESSLGHQLDRKGDMVLFFGTIFGFAVAGYIPVSSLLVLAVGALGGMLLAFRDNRKTSSVNTEKSGPSAFDLFASAGFLLASTALGVVLAGFAYGYSPWLVQAGLAFIMFTAILKRRRFVTW